MVRCCTYSALPYCEKGWYPCLLKKEVTEKPDKKTCAESHGTAGS